MAKQADAAPLEGAALTGIQVRLLLSAPISSSTGKAMSDQDAFNTAVQTLMTEAGFTVYMAHAPGAHDDPSAKLEALLFARSPEALEDASLAVLRVKSKTVN